MELRRGFLHPYWCLQQFLDLSYVLTSLLGKPNWRLTLQKCSPSVLDTDVTPHTLSPGQMRSLFARSPSQNASTFISQLLREHPPLFSHAPFALASLRQQDSQIAASLWLFLYQWQTMLIFATYVQ